jgi:hypothetical protein
MTNQTAKTVSGDHLSRNEIEASKLRARGWLGSGTLGSNIFDILLIVKLLESMSGMEQEVPENDCLFCL